VCFEQAARVSRFLAVGVALTGALIALDLRAAPGSIQDAERQLEQLQARELIELKLPGPNWPAPNPDEEKRMAEEYVRSMVRAWNLSAVEESQLRARVMARLQASLLVRPPTRYENPVTYRLVRRWVGIIEETAKSNFDAEQLRQINRIVFGTLQSAEVNAAHIPTPAGDSLIVFNAGWFPFAELMSRAVAMAMPLYLAQDERLPGGRWQALSTEEGEVRRHLAQNEQILNRFFQPLFSYLTTGRLDSGIAPHFFDPVDEPREGVANMYYDAMGLFVVAHEFGHAVQNSALKIPTVSKSGGRGWDEIRYNWEQEFQADNLGVVLSYLALERRPQNLAAILASVSFFLKSIDLVRRGASLIATGRENVVNISTHPPPTARLQSIRLKLREFLRERQGVGYSENAWEQAVTDAARLERVMDILWERTSPWLLDARKRGATVAPAFNQKD